MIVPRSRLIFWSAAVLLPLSLAAAASPQLGSICLLLAGAFAALALADAIGSQRTLSGIGIDLPPVTRMIKDRAGKLELRIRSNASAQRSLRIALDLPQELPGADQLDVTVPAQTESSTLTWACSPLQRGSYQIKNAYVEGRSTLGFWSRRKHCPIAGEIRVYPNLLPERKNLAAFFIARGGAGMHLQRQVGKGRDFEKLRDYVPGDSFDEIHWKATARRAKPITKTFQIERTQEVYVVIDASRLSGRPARSDSSDTILERLITAALVLGLAAEKQGDLFGLIACTDKVESFVRARSGKAHYHACRDALYRLQPQGVTPDFDELATFIRLRLRRRALVIFLTALDDPAIAESFVKSIELIRRQHLTMINMIRPERVAAMFTSSATPSTVDDLYGEIGAHLRWQKLRELEKVLQRRGVQFSMVENERLSADLVSRYLAVKQRQLI